MKLPHPIIFLRPGFCRAFFCLKFIEKWTKFLWWIINQTNNHMNKKRKKTIERYIQAYNQFDVEGMIKDLHQDVVFENYSGNELSLSIKGIDEFKNQAETSKGYFSKREQEISNWVIKGDVIEVGINFRATLAIDFPNGMKAGNELSLNGKSIFQFSEGKIVRITDKS